MSTEEALAKFFAEAWDRFCDASPLELHELLEASDLVKEYTVTEQDLEDDVFHGEYDVDDQILVLSDIGKAAYDLGKSLNAKTGV